MRLKPCDVAKDKGLKNKKRLRICMIANVMMMYNEISHETFTYFTSVKTTFKRIINEIMMWISFLSIIVN